MQPTSATRTAFIVLGMHRSGTSAMARILSLAGAALPKKVMPGGTGNIKGHWEPIEVADFNDGILNDLGSSWRDVLGPNNHRGEPPVLDRYLDRARAIIHNEYEDHGAIVLKEPRVTLLPGLWKQALADEGFRTVGIVMVRRPDEVAASLAQRNAISEVEALLLWASYMSSADRASRDLPRVVVAYEQLLQDPEKVLDRIEKLDGVHLPKRTWRSSSEANVFLEEDLKHHSFSGALKTPRGLELLEDFYAYFIGMTKGQPPDLTVAEKVENWLQETRAFLAPIVSGAERVIRESLGEVESNLRSEIVNLRQSLGTANEKNAEMKKAADHAADLQRAARAEIHRLSEALRASAPASGHSQDGNNHIQVFESAKIDVVPPDIPLPTLDRAIDFIEDEIANLRSLPERSLTRSIRDRRS